MSDEKDIICVPGSFREYLTDKFANYIYIHGRCSKCEKNVEHEEDLCANPEKYYKSSKAMESIGAVETVLSIWKNCANGYVAAVVTDEDSTTRSKLTHSHAEMVSAGRMTEAERRYEPKIPGHQGSKKSDHGVLPLAHPVIEKLSDPIHFVKNYKGEFYKLVALAKSKSQTCKADAMRLSRNLAYMLAQQTPGDSREEKNFDDFMKASEASFEHHWNNHVHCGDWCQALTWTEEDKIKKRGTFRDKGTHEKEYQQQLVIKEKYLSTDRMQHLFHEFCNNKTEQIHGLVVNVFLPKNSFFCTTIAGRARTFLAVSIDSLGYAEYYDRLYPETGITMTNVTRKYYCLLYTSDAADE